MHSLTMYGKTLTEKGIALDKGNRDFSRICKVDDEGRTDRGKIKEISDLSSEFSDNFNSSKPPSYSPENSYQSQEVVNTVR